MAAKARLIQESCRFFEVASILGCLVPHLPCQNAEAGGIWRRDPVSGPSEVRTLGDRMDVAASSDA
eukprot:6492778-Amphidinium_carterae.3